MHARLAPGTATGARPSVQTAYGTARIAYSRRAGRGARHFVAVRLPPHRCRHRLKIGPGATYGKAGWGGGDPAVVYAVRTPVGSRSSFAPPLTAGVAGRSGVLLTVAGLGARWPFASAGERPLLSRRS